MTDINLEDEVASIAAAEIAKEIDFEIISGLLIGMGWTKIVLQPMTWEHGAEVDGWVASNVKGKFQTMGLVWIFEDPKEAMWFSVRWLS